jgi:hypothetical protein
MAWGVKRTASDLEREIKLELAIRIEGTPRGGAVWIAPGPWSLQSMPSIR